MSLSVFTDKAKKPDDADLSKSLGETKALWDDLKSYVNESFPNIVEDWKHYGKSSGWTMKLLLKKRNLFFSYPGEGFFTVVFIFGDKAVAAIEKEDFPPEIITTLKNTQKFAEGRGLSLTIKNANDIEMVKKLVSIKIAN